MATTFLGYELDVEAEDLGATTVQLKNIGTRHPDQNGAQYRQSW